MKDWRLRGETCAYTCTLEDRDIPQPFDRSLEVFLAGEEGCELDIDRLFGRSFDEVLENCAANPLKIACQTKSVFAQGYKIGVVDNVFGAGVILTSPDDEIVGAYLGCFLGVAPEHQGRGLGAELVFELAYGFGTLPTWHLDIPAYSPAGLAAHQRAWLLARDQSFVRAKGIKKCAKMEGRMAGELDSIFVTSQS